MRNLIQASGPNRLAGLLLGGLYLVGIVHWIFFFYLVFPVGGDRSFIKMEIAPSALLQQRTFKAHTWYEQNNLVRVLQEALRTGTMPYHVPEIGLQTSQVHQNRFLAFPSWPMSPQIVLLYLLDPFTFTVVNLLLLYSIGFYGCLLLRRRYNLGLVSFTFLFLLFNFNGYFIGKVASQGPNQLSYFIMPFLIYAMFRASELEVGDRQSQLHWGILLGLVLSAMLYQGDVHIFVQWVTFVLIWGLRNFRLWRVVLVSLCTAFAMGAARLLPAAVTFGVAPNPHAYVWMGYPDFDTVVEALVLVRTHLSLPIFFWWEYNLYVSVVGLFALVYFGLWGPFMRIDWVRFPGWTAMAVPCLILFFISFRRFKDYIIPNWIPLLNAEGLTTRYMMIPLDILVVIAAINLQGFIDKYWDWRRVKYLLLVGLTTMALYLFNHSRVWRMHKVQWEYDMVTTEGLYGVKHAPERFYDLVLRIGNNMGDTVYIGSVWVGLAISLIAVGVIAGWWGYRWQWQSRRRLNA